MKKIIELLSHESKKTMMKSIMWLLEEMWECVMNDITINPPPTAYKEEWMLQQYKSSIEK
jgi:hypothetical protein